MTLFALLSHPELRGQFHVTRSGHIRHATIRDCYGHDGACPIIALHTITKRHAPRANSDFLAAADELGIARIDANNLVRAADDAPGLANDTYRPDMVRLLVNGEPA